jgi:outer membrane protein assembly factor BamA
MVTMLFFIACVSSPKNTVVHQVSFQGNGGYWSETNDENLRGSMFQKTNRIFAFLAPDLWMVPFEVDSLEDDAQRIKVWYAHHGYFEAEFQGWDIAEYPSVFSDRPHVTIEGVIDEGNAAVIRSVQIQGDMYGQLRRQLSRVHTITPGDVFSLESTEYLESLLLSFLQERSYALPKINTEVLVWPNDCNALQYHKGKCLVANLKAYCPKKCAEQIEKIENCGEDSFCISLIPYREYIQKEKGTVVDLQYTIETGASYRFGEIHLRGDTTVPLEPVLDKVLLEAELTPGSSFRMEKIYRVQESIYRMGLFSVVNIIPEYEEDTELVHLYIELSQSSFGSLNAGVGAESDSGNVGVNLLGELNHSNLWNRLMQLHWTNEVGYAWRPQNIGTSNFNVQHGFVGTSQLHFLIPNLYRSLLSFDGILFNEWGLRPGYQFGYVAVNPSLQYLLPISGQKIGFCTLRFGYEMSYRFYFNADSNLKDSLFPYVLSSIQQEIVLDGRDKAVYTGGGQYLSLLFENSTALLGDVPSFNRFSFEHRAFWSMNSIYELSFKGKSIRRRLLKEDRQPIDLPITMAFRWSGGVIFPFEDQSGFIPFDDRFVLGGGSDVRGWSTFHLGPYSCIEDTNCFANGVQLSPEILPQGGLLRLFGNLEARYYTPTGYGLVLFLDSGRVWNHMENFDIQDLEYSIGVGVRYKSSIGPFRFDVARRLGDTAYFQEEPRWAFHLALSESF